MNKAKLTLIGVAVSFVLVLIPVAVIGAIIQNPIQFIGELIFDIGDVPEVSGEVENMYYGFLESDIGIEVRDYINSKNNEHTEGNGTVENRRIYASSYYTIPLLMIVNNSDIDNYDNMTFESLGLAEKIDTLFDLRYSYSDDTEYLREMKRTPAFSRIRSLSDTTLTMYIIHFLNGNTGEYEIVGDSEVGKNIVKHALSKIGYPYVWGGESDEEGGYDCSGLVYYACKQSGLNHPRTTASVLSTMGVPVTREQLQAGDIITFKTLPPEVSHVGIYIGNGKMVHAPDEGIPVRVDVIFGSDYWERVIYNYRRLY